MLCLLVCIMLSLVSHELCGHEIWSNWAGNQVCYPQRIEYPKTIDDLHRIVKQASLEGHRLRAIGAGFSFSNIACTDDIALSLKHLNQVLSVDTTNRTVRVQAGITFKELNECLEQHNLALSNQPASEYITIGGAIATAATVQVKRGLFRALSLNSS